MRDKVLLKVLLPANRQTYEFWMPLDLSVSVGARLVSRILAARERARYRASDACDLMFVEGPHAGLLAGREQTFRELVAADDLVDGSLLALM